MPKKLPPGIEWDEARGKCRATVHESGKRYRLGRFDTLLDAKAALSIARADVARGIFVPPLARRAEVKREAEETVRAQTTVAEVAEDWLSDFERQVDSGQRKPATLREYRSVLSVHVLPRIGSLPVREVASRDIQRVADRAGSVRTRAKIVACMRRLFNYAVEREILAASGRCPGCSDARASPSIRPPSGVVLSTPGRSPRPPAPRHHRARIRLAEAPYRASVESEGCASGVYDSEKRRGARGDDTHGASPGDP